MCSASFPSGGINKISFRYPHTEIPFFEIGIYSRKRCFSGTLCDAAEMKTPFPAGSGIPAHREW
jgi:hypothetical protein